MLDLELVRRHGFEPYEGTPLDVRTVVAQIPHEVKDGFRFDEVPWHRFGHAYGSADDVPELLARLRSADSAVAGDALRQLGGRIVHQGTVGSVAPLTVPFLLRVAADPSAHHRADTLGLAAAAARQQHWGYGTRDAFVRVATQEMLYDCGGFAMHWSIEASRDAVSADADVLLPLLHDRAPEVRTSACYALATASGETGRIASALRARLTVEHTPVVRASLVLAVAELAREHTDRRAAAWAHALWADPSRPADVRVSAALAWLCLTDGPVPDDLLTTLDALVTDDLARSLGDVPWIAHVDQDKGLARTLDQMLNDAQPGVIDPWDSVVPALRTDTRAARGGPIRSSR
ncbi:hypothetical protein JK359_17050 [Streptomyces actinomycinicus]|uniref:HEAT repeat domain-containing protein n=1 Tax=Streptomyces actinomycinicus TaxID=1695166 RepID=A0A937EJZ9_9ACTN|nr:hypothetical protein [Streptomyces actinomycinicus]MBL1083655.1 hypothetical protein [Streptomyces actinomycinicus]